MKKRLLFMLTVMVLMCVACFSTSAVNCNELSPAAPHVYQKAGVVQATCTERGYDIYRCANSGCTSYYYANYVEAEGHSWNENASYEARESGSYFLKYQHCDSCNLDDYEREGTALVKYFKVEFFNGQALDKEVETVTVESYGKTYEVPVDYTVLAASTKIKLLQSGVYVKEGESITYVGKKPIRTKDVRYGEFRFVGWTKNVNYDVVESTTAIIGSDVDYNITVKDVHENAQYYAAWEGVNVTYKTIVYNSDGQQLLIAQNVPHGGSIDYPFSYPTRKSETSVDFIFAGWEIGTKTAAKDQYDFYSKDGAHIKDIPIYSGDAIKAYHETTPRKYVIEFCDKAWNIMKTEEISYNSEVVDATVGFDYKNFADETGTYLFEYRGYWETEKGNKVYLDSFTVPKGSVDYNDPIYLKDVDGNYFKTIDGNSNLEIESIHDYYNNKAGYFNKNIITYVFPVNEDGDNLVNASGNALCLLVYDKGIQVIDVNGNRVAFTEEDAKKVRNIKIRPAYYQRVIDRTVIIETRLPADEKIPEDYTKGLVVQVTNENGQLLASGVTDNFKCVLNLPKAEIYNITVASTNGKYYSEKGIVWSVFKAMYDNHENIIMDLSVDKDYSEETQARCRCICHNTFFRGIWVRVLNILYRLFGIKYVCCYDMYATIGDLLAYTK